MATATENDGRCIEAMVDAFYTRALDDPVLGPVFRDVAHFDLSAHAPVMYQFWRTLLLDTHEYHGNAFAPHVAINDQIPLSRAHFDRWMALFTEAADTHLPPALAAKAKVKAGNIARMLAAKLAA